MGEKGGTVKELKDLVAKREDACMATTKDRRISKLKGSNCTVRQELTKARQLMGEQASYMLTWCSSVTCRTLYV